MRTNQSKAKNGLQHMYKPFASKGFLVPACDDLLLVMGVFGKPLVQLAFVFAELKLNN